MASPQPRVSNPKTPTQHALSPAPTVREPHTSGPSTASQRTSFHSDRRYPRWHMLESDWTGAKSRSQIADSVCPTKGKVAPIMLHYRQTSPLFVPAATQRRVPGWGSTICAVCHRLGYEVRAWWKREGSCRASSLIYTYQNVSCFKGGGNKEVRWSRKELNMAVARRSWWLPVSSAICLAFPYSAGMDIWCEACSLGQCTAWDTDHYRRSVEYLLTGCVIPARAVALACTTALLTPYKKLDWHCR